MLLGELIEGLEKLDPDMVVPEGWADPHSYRGYYDQVAFERAPNVTVRSMLAHARSAVGTTYQGYKGGDYTMDRQTMTHIAEYGESNGDDTTMVRWFLGIETQRIRARAERLGQLLKKAFQGVTLIDEEDGPGWYNAALDEFPDVVLDPPPRRTRVRCAADAEARARELFPDADITVESDRASGNLIVDL